MKGFLTHRGYYQFLFFLVLGLYLILLPQFFIYMNRIHYFGVFLEHTQGNYIVNHVDPNGEGSYLGIKPGDTLVEVNSASPKQNSNVRRWHIVEGSHELEFMNQNHKLVSWMDTFPNHSVQKTGNSVIVSVSISILLMGSGIFLYLKTWNFRYSKEFFLLFSVMSFAILAYIASERGMLLARMTEIFSVSWAPYFLIRFITRFPVRITNQFVRWLKAWYIFIACMLSLLALLILFISQEGNWSLDMLRTGLIVNVVTSILISIGIAFQKSWYAKYSLPRDCRLILSGAMCIGLLPILLFSMTPEILGYNGVPIKNSIMFFLCLPFCLFYLISKNKFLVLEVYIGKTIVYIFYGLLVIVSVSELSDIPSFYLKILMFIVTIFILNSVLQKSLNWVEEIYRPSLGKEYLEDEKKRVWSNMIQTDYIYRTLKLIAEMINRYLGSPGVGIIIYLSPIDLICCSGSLEGRENEMFGARGYIYGNPEWTGIQECIPIGGPIQPSGLIVIALRPNGQELTQEELHFLKKIEMEVSQIINTYAKLDTIEEMRSGFVESRQTQIEMDQKQINQMLIEAQEEEKNRIAHYLHDEILQNLIFLSRSLIELPKLQKLRQIERHSEMLSEKVQDTIYEIRQLCSDLYPSIIEDLGIREAIQWLIREIKEKRNVIVENKSLIQDEELWPFKLKVCVFRNVKELVNNALKHSEATVITIKVESSINEPISCLVSDNGKGFDVPLHIADFVKKKYFGLASVQKKLEQFSGSMSMYSSKQMGTNVSFVIPANNKNEPCEVSSQ
ncbi:ATP-binding protein [Paenibacillus rhizophilus]|uniref:histidine kinase n=1 Tax=Paenibacillus rhizophilus TaxID=1850366 RepID=A0A3N9P1F5_9BACL|nr:ATP-binding protein [Paenibacillus rhizophilus]RQW09675.1 hypothetical protein EH198_18040 [Paenibacillus rhizophilus]